MPHLQQVSQCDRDRDCRSVTNHYPASRAQGLLLPPEISISLCHGNYCLLSESFKCLPPGHLACNVQSGGHFGYICIFISQSIRRFIICHPLATICACRLPTCGVVRQAAHVTTACQELFNPGSLLVVCPGPGISFNFLAAHM